MSSPSPAPLTIGEVIRTAFPLFLVGLTLRPLTTAVGPVLPEIRAEFSMSATTAAMLTTLPVVIFALGAFLVPRLLHHWAPNVAIAGALLTIAFGAHLRVVPLVAALFLGTLLIGVGVAIGNVAPSIITRRDFPTSIGIAMGLLAGAISLAPSIAALITFPLTEAIGSWRWAMEGWALLPLIVLIPWVRYMRRHQEDVRLTVARDLRGLARNPLAWALAIYFGVQSTNFYCLVSWLPTILRESGINPTIAGYQLALLVLAGFPAGLLIPGIAARRVSQVRLCVGVVIIFAIGLLGIYLYATTGWWPHGVWVWVILLGLGMGSSFPLALTLVLLRTESPEMARDLTVFMQGYGYIISAMGPLILGAIRDISNSWSLGFLALAIALVIQLFTGMRVSRPVIIKA